MYQCNEKSKFIQITVDTDPVRLVAGCMAIVAQNRFSFAGNGQVYLVMLEVL
jgi:hypothetical protein